MLLLRDLVKVNQQLEKRRTNTTLPASPPTAGNPLTHSPHSSNNSAERFPRDVRAGEDEPPAHTGLAPRRARPLTGISEGDETFAAAQAGYLLADDNDSRALQRNSQHLQHPLNPFDDRASVATDDNTSFVSSSTNVIPIAFVPSHPTPVGGIGPSAARGVGAPGAGAQSTLQAARERAAVSGRLRVGIAASVPGQPSLANLSAGLAPLVSAAPSRPARSPDLDLRLTPNTPQNGIETLLTTDPYGHGQKNSRASFATTRSAAPSFMSGTSSVGGMMDAPVIMTSRQVHMGVRQAAEVVRIPHQQAEEEGFLAVPGAQEKIEDDMRTPTGTMFRRSRPESSDASSFATFAIGDGPGAVGNPFTDPVHYGYKDVRASSSTSISVSTTGMGEEHRLQPQRSTATFGEPQSSNPRATYASSVITNITDDGQSAHHAQGGDLRFSMGSLAGSSHHHQPYARDSVSTQGGSGTIGEARRVYVGTQGHAAPTAWQTRGSSSLAFATSAAANEEDYSMPLARPRPGFAADSPYQGQEYGAGGRESMMSGRSDDSFLNAIIPPKFNHSSALGTTSITSGDSPSSGRVQHLPTSLSTETFSSPSALFIRPGPGTSSITGQRNRAQQESPTPSPSKQASDARHTLGLSGFEFQIGDEEDAELPPPLPVADHKWA
ncbi:hypothetical protein QFC24_000894 [Naganishia onofrii]|uniref:Uncharacterized protein n=1 Tax=Naganishia onofrii TaxID=1851511 RepID=A0ACC2XVT5_9TREE|nr:hypothetical protein QFC24_000894 [Naganishia onofrii]